MMTAMCVLNTNAVFVVTQKRQIIITSFKRRKKNTVRSQQITLELRTVVVRMQKILNHIRLLANERGEVGVSVCSVLAELNCAH